MLLIIDGCQRIIIRDISRTALRLSAVAYSLMARYRPSRQQAGKSIVPRRRGLSRKRQ